MDKQAADTIVNRIFGLETEYGLTCASTEGGRPPLEVDKAARRLFEPVIQRYRTTNVFAPNGGRLYLDVGSHPEYATAECNRLADLLAQDRAGDQLMSDLVMQANHKLDQEGIPGQIHLLKNNVDYVGNSCGCHENYLLYRDANFRQTADALISFFSTRQILVGAGYVDPQTGQYCFSQRAEQMDDPVSAATTRSRPIINTRDEPLADAEQYRRMHVIVGDSNICTTTTALKVAMTLALLFALEQGMELDDLALAHPMQAITQINRDLTGRRPLPLKSGKSLSALQIQTQIMRRTRQVLAGSQPGKQLFRALQLPGFDPFELWERALQALYDGALEVVGTEIDWVIKKGLLQRSAQRRQLALHHPLLRRLDFAYHDIGPAGLRQKLVDTGLMKDAISEPEVDRAMGVPPQTTRAVLRGKVIQAAHRQRRDLSVDWLHLRLDESKLPTVTLGDPFSTCNPKVDELLAELA